MKDYYDKNYANEKNMNDYYYDYFNEKNMNDYYKKRTKYAIISIVFCSIIIVFSFFLFGLPIYIFSFDSEYVILILTVNIIIYIGLIATALIFTVLTLLAHFKIEKLR